MSETQSGSQRPEPGHAGDMPTSTQGKGEDSTGVGNQSPGPVVPGTGSAPSSPPSPGALLRAAREAAGLDRPALALALKVSVRKLEALEQDRFDQLPDLVFARALASSVCRTLKVDAREILALFPQTQAPRLLNDDSGLNTPFRTPADIARTPLLDRLSRPMVLTALAILLGAVVIVFFPSMSPSPASTVTEAVPHAAVDAGTPVPVAAKEGEPQPNVEAPTPSTPETSASPAPSRATSSPAPAVLPAPAAALASSSAPTPTVPSIAPGNAAPRVGSSPAVVSSVASPTPAAREIAFKTRGPSWIEVFDASGNLLISRLVQAGELASVKGVGPLRVTVGRTDLTDVTYEGKPFDLSPYARQGVARFEVKP